MGSPRAGRGVFCPLSRQITETITVYSNKKIQFRDTGIYIQSSADGKLTFSSDGSGADDFIFSGNVTFQNDITVQGDFAFGNASTDNLTVNGDLIIADDQKLHFGTGEDVSFEYDEDGNDVLAITGAKWWFNNSGGAVASSGLFFGAGTSASPATTSAAGNMFIEFRTQSTATSGDSRGLYWRHELKGAGVSGEAIRAFTKISAAVSTARGAHISLDINNSPAGSITGLGVGVDAQLLLGNIAVGAGGTYAVVNAEIYSAGATTDWGAATELSYFRVVNGGNATGMADVDDDAFLFSLTGFTSGSAKMWYDNQGAAPANIEEWLKVKTPGGTRWLPLYDAVV